MEQNDKDQGGFEKIVIEGREKLAPEERRKAPRQHYWLRHAAIIAKFQNACSGKKTGGLRPPEPFPTERCSRPSVLLVGIHNHRAQGEAEGDADDDAK
jgi:hypothetical protein